jgi:hypothetical protein
MPRFYPPDAPVPTELRMPECFLRMLRATDVELDYAAVMASQEMLRAKSGGRWPRPDFTIEENLADLQEHEADFQQRSGFTYTVMTLDETQCLGCVYIYPLAALLNAAHLPEPGDDEAQVRFWVRPECVADDLDRRLFATLRSWLAEEWDFQRVLWRVASPEARQIQLMQEAGVTPQYTIMNKSGQEVFLFG